MTAPPSPPAGPGTEEGAAVVRDHRTDRLREVSGSVGDGARPAWSTARTLPDEATFRLRVNGQVEEVTCRGDTPLLYLLRNDLALKGSRFGCGLAQCGACMVLLDGHPTPSCDVSVRAAEGHDVVTVEGLADDRGMRALQRSFLDLQAAQCGYCSSGVLVAACALLRDDATPDRPRVARALERHLCRCGSHGRVVRAVLAAADALRGTGAATGRPDPDGGRGDDRGPGPAVAP